MMEIHDELTSEDSRLTRAYLRRIAGVVLCGALLVATVIWATKAYPEEPQAVAFVAEAGDNKLFIFPDPCPLGGWFEKWKKARWVFNGQSFEACWRIQRDGDGLYVHTVDAAGDAGVMPVDLFKKVEAI